MGQLYEEYLSAGEDWMQSSLVVNASRKMAAKRKGKYRMIPFKDLKAQYGVPVAKSLRDAKKDQEAKKGEDPVTYWQEHPDMKHANVSAATKEDWYVTKKTSCTVMYAGLGVGPRLGLACLWGWCWGWTLCGIESCWWSGRKTNS